MSGALLRLVQPDEEAVYRLRQNRPDPRTSQRVRIADAAASCVARTGVAKTTLDDVAREAGCSRATVYRTFPGGKEEVIAAVVDTEVARFFSSVAVEMGSAESLEDVIVAGMVATATQIEEHAALRFVLDNEPGILLPYLAFEPLGGVLDVAAGLAAPFLARWLDFEDARRVADWAARIVLSYVSNPAPGTDITDVRCTRRLVQTFVMPGANALAAEPVS
ncbi:MAG: TetR/AcrR family transcriptional regulator [Acidimicrobiales bacterium]